MSNTSSTSHSSEGSSSASLPQHVHESHRLQSSETSLSSDDKDQLLFVISRRTYLALRDAPNVRIQWIAETRYRFYSTQGALGGFRPDFLEKIQVYENETVDMVAEAVANIVEDARMTFQGKQYDLKAMALTKKERGFHGVKKVWGRGSQRWNQRAITLQRVVVGVEGNLDGYKGC